jgi:hypothetical protein
MAFFDVPYSFDLTGQEVVAMFRPSHPLP